MPKENVFKTKLQLKTRSKYILKIVTIILKSKYECMQTISCSTLKKKNQELHFIPNTHFHTKLQIPAMSSTSRTYTLKFIHMSFGMADGMKP